MTSFDFSKNNLELFNPNDFLYGIANEDPWLAQNYIISFFINNFSMKNEDFFCFIENPGINYQTSLTKTVLNSWESKQVIFLSPDFYKIYYHIIKNFKGYIFLLDLSIYEFNFIENIRILSIETEEKSLQPYSNYSYDQYIKLNHGSYHEEILYESFKKGSMDWEYIRKNWDFLHWFFGFWLSNILIKNQYVHWNYIKSLILLIEYFPCLYSFFPEKKQLTCDFIINITQYCKKI